MSKFTFSKGNSFAKQQRRKSSEEDKAKILADKEAQKAELLEKIRKIEQEIEIEQEKKDIIDDDDDEDIDIEEEEEIQKHYDAIVSKTKNSKSKILLKFLEQKCKSIREVINIEDVIAQETIEVEKTLASCKGSGSKGSKDSGSTSGSKTSRDMTVVQEPKQVESFKLDKEYYLIYGAVQSGKTQFLQGITIAHIALSRCPVIVILRNCRGDAQQLSNRFTDFIKEQNQYFKEAGFSASNVLKYFYVGGNKSEESLRKAFTNCNMIVAIANKTQLNRLARVITPETKYATVIDEADSVAYGKDDVQFRETLHRSILANSGRTYAITATTFNIIFSEKNIPTKNIISLPIKTEYRGLQKIQMKVIDPKNETELEDYLTLLSDRNAYEHKVDDSLHRGLKKTDHPMIMLIKKYHRKLKQQELARQVVEIGNWSEVIVFNGDGLTMYSKHIEALAEIIRGGVIGEKFKIKPKTVHIEKNDGKYYLTVKAQIDEGLQYYKELHMSSKSTRISHLAIVSEGMADRGISFVSKDYKWHLTAQYYEPNKKVFADNIIQSIRLCGNYKDDLPSVLYSTEKVCDDLAKCFLVQEEMLMRCKRCKASEKVKSIPRVLRKMQLCSEKVPEKRKFGVQDCILENVVEGEDGGVEMREYNKMLEKIGRLQVSGREELKDEEDNVLQVVQRSKVKSTKLDLFDHICKYIRDNNLLGQWVNASVTYRGSAPGQDQELPDRQTVHHWFRSKKEHDEAGKFFYLRKRKLNYQIKLDK
jgi:hypothetical protein